MKNNNDGLLANVTWREMVNVLGLVVGLTAVWFQTTEKITILDHMVSSLQSEVSAVKTEVRDLKVSDKEIVAKLDLEVKNLTKQVNDLTLMVLKHSRERD